MQLSTENGRIFYGAISGVSKQGSFPYGDAIAEQVLSEHPEINAKLGYPITSNPDGIASLDD